MATAFYKVLVGQHCDKAGKVYVAGDIVPSETDLVASFGSNKFRKVKGKGKPKVEVVEEEFEEEDEDEEDEEDFDEEDPTPNKKKAGPEGSEDVTAKFKVKDSAVKVWKGARGFYQVTRDDTPVHAGSIREKKVIELLKTL